MNKHISFLLALLFLCICLSSCQKIEATAPSCDQLIAAYGDAGYHVFHSETEDDSYDWNCYVKVWLEDEDDYAFFYFYETPEEARARDAEREYNVLLYLFSLIYGDAHWLHTETCGAIEYEYANAELLAPFEKLING